MSLHLSALTSISGLPIFSRLFNENKDTEKIAFVNIATLNGINLFSDANNCKLYFASTKKSLIYWKSFNSLTLILILKNDIKINHSDSSLDNLLSLIFNIILMFCPYKDLKDENLEKIKPQIKSSYFIIDFVIQEFFKKTNLAIETNCLEHNSILLKNFDLAESLIDVVSKNVESLFVCLTVDSKIVCTTKNYSEKLLNSIDGLLIYLLIKSKLNSLNKSENYFEIEIFLPFNCSEALSRLIYYEFDEKCSIIMLCGEQPSTQFIINNLLEPVKKSQNYNQLFNELSTKYLIQLELSLDDKLINYSFFNFKAKNFFKNGFFDLEKLSSLNSLLSIVDFNEDKEQIFTFNNYKIYSLIKKNEKQAIFVMFSKTMNLNEIKTNGSKTINLVLKVLKKNKM